MIGKKAIQSQQSANKTTPIIQIQTTPTIIEIKTSPIIEIKTTPIIEIKTIPIIEIKTTPKARLWRELDFLILSEVVWWHVVVVLGLASWSEGGWRVGGWGGFGHLMLSKN